MYIERKLSNSLLSSAQEFPVVALLGPRQSGKTTLAQHVFPDHKYVSLEDPDIRVLANLDPRRFLADYPSHHGIILDEFQQAPQLLSYIQTIVDRDNHNGFFILTGSQNFLMNQAISQSLAGRVAILTLLPLSISELKAAKLLPSRIEEIVFNGSMPRFYAHQVQVQRLYTGYIKTYLERDVRQLKKVSNLDTFQRFISLCAARSGQILNLTSLGNDCDVSDKTAKEWISLLESSYIIFLLRPYYRNFGKRLIKSPKLYFIDTGLACSLLRIRSYEDLIIHSARGSLIENFLIIDLLKQQYNLEQVPSLYFWRDQRGREIDCILDETHEPVPVEIKSSKTVNKSYFTNMLYWREVTKLTGHPNYLIYSGDEDQNWPDGNVISWKNSGSFIK